mgnify:CR=1 FL=1|jgi:hypothetical protein
MRALVLAAAVVWLCGCAGRPSLTAAELPDDFGLSVTVLPGSDMQAAWYVLEPDGSLRAAIGERRHDSVRPGLVRRLSREQVRHVWETVVDAGLADHDRHGQRVSPTASRALGGAAIVELAAMGRRSTVAVGRADARTVDGVRKVVEELRSLAWAKGG